MPAGLSASLFAIALGALALFLGEWGGTIFFWVIAAATFEKDWEEYKAVKAQRKKELDEIMARHKK